MDSNKIKNIDKELLRDRIKELEFEANRKLNLRYNTLSFFVTYLSVSVILFIFSLEYNSGKFFIFIFGVSIVLNLFAIGIFDYLYDGGYYETKLINKNYNLLLGRKKI